MQRRILNLPKDVQEQLILYGHHTVMAGAREAAMSLTVPFRSRIKGMSSQEYVQVLGNMATVIDCADCILYMALEPGQYPTLMTDLQTLHDLAWILTHPIGADDNDCEEVAKQMIQMVCGEKSMEAFNYNKVLTAKSMSFMGETKVREYLMTDCRKNIDGRDLVMAIRGDVLYYSQRPNLSEAEEARMAKELAFLGQVPFQGVQKTPLDFMCEMLLQRYDKAEQAALGKWLQAAAEERPAPPYPTLDEMWEILNKS